MSSVVLDTDFWSFLFKRDSRAESYRAYLEGNALFVSFQTVAELYQWAEMADWGESRRARLQEWLENFQVLGYDDATALIWARIRAERNRLAAPCQHKMLGSPLVHCGIFVRWSPIMLATIQT